MSAEVSIYESAWVNDKDESILVDTKSIYLNGEEYCETQVFVATNPDEGEWEMVDVISHNETDENDLKAIHDKIVADWSNK